jgi:hypothetical protein
MADRNTPVTVLVGDDKHPFHLEEQQLCACSPFFRSVLTNGFKETHERVVLLPEVDVETFQVFEGWLSNLKLSEFKDLDWLFDCESPVFEDLDWPLLCKFFFLTDYLQASWAQKPLLQALASKRNKNRVVPLSLIPAIYENTPPGSPLRRLWIGWVIQYTTPEIFEGDDWVFPEEFLRELAAAQVRHTQKLAKELKRARGIADSAMMR